MEGLDCQDCQISCVAVGSFVKVVGVLYLSILSKGLLPYLRPRCGESGELIPW